MAQNLHYGRSAQQPFQFYGQLHHGVVLRLLLTLIKEFCTVVFTGFVAQLLSNAVAQTSHESIFANLLNYGAVQVW
jgi:hypothetical protein